MSHCELDSEVLLTEDYSGIPVSHGLLTGLGRNASEPRQLSFITQPWMNLESPTSVLNL